MLSWRSNDGPCVRTIAAAASFTYDLRRVPQNQKELRCSAMHAFAPCVVAAVYFFFALTAADGAPAHAHAPRCGFASAEGRGAQTSVLGENGKRSPVLYPCYVQATQQRRSVN